MASGQPPTAVSRATRIVGAWCCGVGKVGGFRVGEAAKAARPQGAPCGRSGSARPADGGPRNEATYRAAGSLTRRRFGWTVWLRFVASIVPPAVTVNLANERQHSIGRARVSRARRQKVAAARPWARIGAFQLIHYRRRENVLHSPHSPARITCDGNPWQATGGGFPAGARRGAVRVRLVAGAGQAG